MDRFFAANQRRVSLWLLSLVAISFVGPASLAHAAVTPTGDVLPSAPPPATWTTSTPAYIGKTGSGTLTVNGGSTLLSGYGTIGYNSGSKGVVNVTGTGSAWNPNDDLYVAYSGGGTLSITSGGSITCGGYTHVGLNARGAVTVDGAGSTWTQQLASLYLGELNNGTFTVSNGGTVHNVMAFIGCGSSGSSVARGAITVDGAGSTWNNDNTLFVGYSSSGTFTVSNGGAVHTRFTNIGESVGSTGIATVTGSGSLLDSNYGLAVGNSGTGSLLVNNGGSVSAAAGCSIGSSLNAKGTITVDGGGSTFNSGSDLYVGGSGGGTLAITNGGSVSVAAATFVGAYAGSTGTIQFGANGGTLSTQSLLASPSQLTGAGTINSCGFVSDVNLMFDTTHPLKQTSAYTHSGQTVTLNLDMATNPYGNGCLGAGWQGAGSLTIQAGSKVRSGDGYVGYGSGSTGVARRGMVRRGRVVSVQAVPSRRRGTSALGRQRRSSTRWPWVTGLEASPAAHLH